MDRFGEWRPIEPAADDDGPKPPSADEPAKPAKPEANANNVRLVGLLTAGVLAGIGVVIWLTSANPPPSFAVNGQAVVFDARSSASPDGASASEQLGDAEIVVDVEGAVIRPGVHRLAAGSRVGDAIAVAGGYSAQVDIGSAAALLNLAAELADGAKIHVPARGESAAASAVPQQPGSAGPGGPPGLINVNSAATDQLDTLPGIGPVTAAKIIAAREQAPFGSVDELLSREVVGASTFEKIRALITVGP